MYVRLIANFVVAIFENKCYIGEEGEANEKDDIPLS